MKFHLASKLNIKRDFVFLTPLSIFAYIKL